MDKKKQPRTTDSRGCRDSDTGQHEWFLDVEYDAVNPPEVCKHCGAPKPQPKEKKNAGK